nr:hypothetical protein [Pseudomonadota bacterium]
RLEAAGTSLDAADAGMKKMLADFRKQEFLQHADFDTPYQDQKQVLPLGEEPLTVTDVDAAPLPNGRLRLSFNENVPGQAAPVSEPPAQPRRFQMEMEPRLMQGLLHLLEQALAQSRWREPFEPPAAATDDATLPDGSGHPARPRYLN